jgi:hypothetical protein
MIPYTPEELLQRDVDGENTPEESAALARLIRESPALRAKREALNRVVAELRRVRMAEAPQPLAADVRRQIHLTASRPSAGWGQLQAAFTRKPALGHVMTLAAGLVIGGMGVALSDPSALFSRADAPSAAGAILPRGRLGAPDVLDRHHLSVAGIEGHAATRMSGGHLMAEVSIDSGGPVDVTLDFDPLLFAPVAFRLDDGARGAASLQAGRLQIAAAAPGTYRLLLAPAGPQRPSLRLRLQAPGALLEKDLKTTAEER